MAYPSEILPEPLPADPLVLLDQWMTEALERRLQPNPNAMVVATGGTGDLSARVVLCKKIVPNPGYVVFYTNYQSLKGHQLAGNPRAAAVIHWDHLHRQIRIEGPVVTAPAAESDAYFASRPWQSRLGAWASAQSKPVASRAQLDEAVEAAARRFGTPIPGREDPGAAADFAIPRPAHWGGYRLWVERIELWSEGAGRIHDRGQWTRALSKRADGQFAAGAWSATRLQP